MHLTYHLVYHRNAIHACTFCNSLLNSQLNTVSHIHRRPVNSIETQARQQLYNFVASIKQNLSQHMYKDPIIAFSHVPLNELHSPILKFKILLSLRPDFIFSGHVHHAMYTAHSYANGRVAKEFTIPTCSYRMGEARMGVGAVVIGMCTVLSRSTCM